MQWSDEWSHLKRVAEMAYSSPGLQGFCVYNACGGGTGSGLGCLMLERLRLGRMSWMRTQV